MKRAGIATAGKSRALAIALALALAAGAAVPVAPGRGGHTIAQSGPVVVANSADGVPLRAEPDYGAEVIAVLATGAVVNLRTEEADTVYDPDGTTRWWPVAVDGQTGWVAGFFLEIPGLSDAPADATDGAPPAVPEQGPVEAPAEDPTGPDPGGATARVADPEGVNLRAEPTTWAATLTSVPFDAVVELRIDEADTVYGEGVRWWPVRFEGQAGWVVGDYLAPDLGPLLPADVPAEAAPPEAPAVVPPAVAVFAPGSYVAAVTDDGTGLNIRADAAPDAERVGFVPENDVVQVMDGPFYDPTGTPWYLITDGDATGYVTGVYLAQAAQPAPPADEPAPPDAPAPPAPPAPAPEPPAGLATGSFIYPVADFTFTQEYGCSPYWFEPWEPAIGCNFHNGIDLANSAYTPLMAADGGVVEYAGWCDCGLGYYVKIDHGNGFKTVYGHMAEQPWVSTGQRVGRGEVIGPMGSTGNSTGPHVHFMIEVNGSTVDPLGYL